MPDLCIKFKFLLHERRFTWASVPVKLIIPSWESWLVQKANPMPWGTVVVTLWSTSKRGELGQWFFTNVAVYWLRKHYPTASWTLPCCFSNQTHPIVLGRSSVLSEHGHIDLVSVRYGSDKSFISAVCKSVMHKFESHLSSAFPCRALPWSVGKLTAKIVPTNSVLWRAKNKCTGKELDAIFKQLTFILFMGSNSLRLVSSKIDTCCLYVPEVFMKLWKCRLQWLQQISTLKLYTMILMPC